MLVNVLHKMSVFAEVYREPHGHIWLGQVNAYPQIQSLQYNML